ncbi:thiamine pyrophosphate-binding protein [Emcibacter nanhaiensis]|uniref:Thiamine pyrophosphate-binding protein n=1 Tax=Emcibacter nanhaiensis TaxID=1505037 RepID=A0A501PPJ4_9PROT|nr:thiamine pyrophosphate-binding protein [Emcibacter nanhaiensis]TPD61691.1 thiamine pyrophosphate-binding protein [Emcibacter nanhaiensis]
MGKNTSAAEILVQCLLANGTDRAFCVPGESYLSVLDALYDVREQIDLITCRQEAGAANMAEAYGKLTGRPGICFVTRGPGATNASIGVHTAFQDSTPMILLIGQVARDQYDREAFQEVDYRQMFGPLAKWVAEIREADRIPEYINRAFHVALSGRPGPVVLALPEDMLTDEVEAISSLLPATPPVAAPDRASLDQLAVELQQAKQPVVILGGRGWSDQSLDDIRQFAEQQQLPVGCAFRYQDLFDNHHPHYIGDVGIGVNPKLFQRLQEADLILNIGARLGEMTSSGYKLLNIPFPKQKLVMVHTGAEETGHVYRAHLSFTCSLPEMATALKALPVGDVADRSDWLAGARADYEAWSNPLGDLRGSRTGKVQLGEIYAYLNRAMPKDAILTNGAGNFSIWLHRFFRYSTFPSQLAPTSGAMGYGLPAALGAKVAAPDRPVVCFTGDGDFLMTGQELATAAHHRLPVTILLFNNGMYGTIRMHQERNYPDRVVATELTNPDFTALAKAYGLDGVKVTTTGDFAPAFEAALKNDKTTLIEIIVDPQALTPAATLDDIRKK